MSTVAIVIAISNFYCAAICIAIAVPLMRRRVKPNKLYGIRFKKSYESEELWYAINEYGGRRMFFWSIFVVIAGVIPFFVPMEKNDPIMVITALAPLVYIIAVLESWRYAKKL